VSQETCPGWSKLALFARRSVAIGLAILARLFSFWRVGIGILRRRVEARAATTETFVRGDFLRDAWLRCGARDGARCDKRSGIVAEQRGKD
jgi:hypothetical protein